MCSDEYAGFYLNGPIGAITGISLAIIRIPNAKLETEVNVSLKKQLNRLDLPGCVLFSASVLMLLLAIDWGGVTYAWGSPTIINLLWGALFSLCIFLFWEYQQGPTSLLPLEIFRNPIVSCAAATSIMSYGGLYVIIMYLPLWFQAVKGVSPLTSGVDYLPSVVTTTIGTVLSGILGWLKFFHDIYAMLNYYSLEYWLLHPFHDNWKRNSSNRGGLDDYFHSIHNKGYLDMLPASQWGGTRHDVAAAHYGNSGQSSKRSIIHWHGTRCLLSELWSLCLYLARTDHF